MDHGSGRQLVGGPRVVVVGWLFFVSPQRSKADRLDAQVDAAHTELRATAADRYCEEAEHARLGEGGGAGAARRAAGLEDPASADRAGGGVADGARKHHARHAGAGRRPAGAADLARVQGPVLRAAEAPEAAPSERDRHGQQDRGQGPAVHGGQHHVRRRRTRRPNGAHRGASADIQATITLNAFMYQAAPPAATPTDHRDSDGRCADGLMTSTAARRTKAKAAAQQRAAKERRQRYMVAALVRAARRRARVRGAEAHEGAAAARLRAPRLPPW